MTRLRMMVETWSSRFVGSAHDGLPGSLAFHQPSLLIQPPKMKEINASLKVLMSVAFLAQAMLLAQFCIQVWTSVAVHT